MKSLRPACVPGQQHHRQRPIIPPLARSCSLMLDCRAHGQGGRWPWPSSTFPAVWAFPTARSNPPRTSPPSARGCAWPMKRCSRLHGVQECRHCKTELGRYMTGPHGCLVSHGHPPKAHLQGVYRPGCLRGQPHAPGHVRRLPPHHRRRARKTRPATTSTTSLVRLCENNDKFAIDRHAAARSTWAIWWSSTTPARTASPWATTTTAACAPRRYCYREDGTFQLIRRAETPPGLFCHPGY